MKIRLKRLLNVYFLKLLKFYVYAFKQAQLLSLNTVLIFTVLYFCITINQKDFTLPLLRLTSTEDEGASSVKYISNSFPIWKYF